jgi:hypothetical protein
LKAAHCEEEQARKQFFFEKKNQETFIFWEALRWRQPR